VDDPGFDLDLELDPWDLSVDLLLLLPDFDFEPEVTFFLDFFGYSSVSIRLEEEKLT
jgi:hypothetical protein